MLATWVEAGQDPEAFWQITLREVAAVLDGAALRLKREHNDRAWLAWHTAALTRATKLPRLKTLLHGAPPPRKQTVEEQISVAKKWTEALRLVGVKGS